MFQKLDDVEKKYEDLTQKISDPAIISAQNEWKTYMKEHSDLEPIVLKYREYKKTKQSLEEAKQMLNDPELKELAEIASLWNLLTNFSSSAKSPLNIFTATFLFKIVSKAK